MNELKLETRRGIKCRVLEAGKGAPVVFFHGAGGLLGKEDMLETLARRFHVYAPEWPGYGADSGEEKLDDMLDFALHGWDVVEALRLDARPSLIGHSMGGMIAAEMACVANSAVEKLVLITPAGLWIDEHPLPDIFAMLPFELAHALFADPKAGEKILTGGIDFSNMDALQTFMVANSRRLGTAGKILFPIPNRRLSKRLYRLNAPTLLVWGREDKLIPLVYAERWRQLVPKAQLSVIDAAGHMVPYEQPEKTTAEIERFLAHLIERALNAARRGRLLLLAGAGVGLAFAALGTLAPRSSALDPGAGEVARVNGVPLRAAELERALERIEADTRKAPSDDERRRILLRLVDDELLVQRGVALGLSESDPTVRKALASAVIASVVADASSAAPTELELEAFFAANRGYFANASRVRALRIFVRDGPSADERVVSALSALDAGAAPAEVAARFGDATPLVLPDALLPEPKLRELLGPTEAQIALALAPGSHSAVVASVGGRAILVSLEHEPGASPLLEAVRPQVEAEWRRREGEEALATYLAALRREAEVRVADEPP